MAVKNIVYDHHVTLIGPYTSLQGVFQGPLWYYLLSIATIVVRGDPWGGIILMFFFSVSTFAAASLLMKKLFGYKAFIFTLIFFAVSPEAIASATYSWNPHPMWLVIVLYIFAFFELIRRKSKQHLIVWPLIAIMFHFEAALGFFILAASLIYIAIFARSLFKQRYFVYGLLIAGIFFLPQILFDLRHDFLMSRSILHIFSGSDRGLFAGGELRDPWHLVNNHISSFYYNFETAFLRDGYLVYLPRCMIIFFAAMILFGKKLKLFTDKESDFIYMIAKLIAITVAFSFVYPFPIRYWFLTGFQSVYVLLAALFFAKLWERKAGKMVITLLVIVSLFYIGERLDRLYIHPPNEGGVAKIKGKLEAIDAIYTDIEGKPFNLFVFTPPVNTDAYDYLMWWYGKGKYGYLPGQEKVGIFYLLIEPDPAKPWSYKGWLETVVKTGTVLETKELPSGFIIQKRFGEAENAT